MESNPDLYSGFGEADPHGNFFSHEDIRIVRLGEAPLQLVELSGCEARPVPFLLSGLVAVVRAAPHLTPERRQRAVAHTPQSGLVQDFQFTLVTFQVFAAHFLYACNEKKEIETEIFRHWHCQLSKN